jgi:hypothetical protein
MFLMVAITAATAIIDVSQLQTVPFDSGGFAEEVLVPASM